MTIFVPASQDSSSRASGTRVVFPAPGGARSTAALDAPSARRTSSSTASIGSGGGAGRGVLRDGAGGEVLGEVGVPPAVGGAAPSGEGRTKNLHDHQQMLGRGG